MQWFIDLIIDAIGVPPVYINRGVASDVDFDTGDFNVGPGWHNFDIPAFVPENASAMCLQVGLKATAVNKLLIIAYTDSAPNYNIGNIITQVADQTIYGFFVIPTNAERKIYYKVSPGTYTVLQLTICGWWL